MSSIATFYVLSEASRAAFDDAQRDQKTVAYKRGLFGTKEIVTGDQFLWEYLDSTDRLGFLVSGDMWVRGWG
jgi:2-hydroxychromene-2-carboxylate isomerase